MILNARCIFRSAALAGVAACFLACSGESEPAADQAPAATPGAPLEAPAGAEPGAAPIALEDLYEWDATAGAPRNLAADTAECQAQITGQGLAGVAQHIGCMRRLGWKTRSPAS